MADTLTSNLLNSLSGSSNTATDQVVNAYRQTQQYKITALTDKTKKLQGIQSFYTNLQSKINALISNIDTFEASDASNKFISRSISSSDGTVITASASSDAIPAVNQIKVDRLATNDTLISDRKALSELFTNTGSFSFKLKVGENEFVINGSISSGATNEEAMKSITTAINQTTDIGINASFIKDTSKTGRITLLSTKTGSSNNISFSDSPILEELGITNGLLNPDSNSRTLASSLKAGFKTNETSSLDSKMQINGIEIFRNSNSVNDVLSGITLNLLKPQTASDQAVTLTTQVDSKAVESLINPILNNYNSLLQYIKQNQSTTRNESAVSSLYTRLRAVASSAISTINSSDAQYLTEIGIKINTDGTLTISDSDKLKAALESSPLKVARLFTSGDGFAVRLKNIVSTLVGDDGILKQKTLNISNQINQTQTKQKDTQSRIDTQANALRKQYTSILQTYLEAQGQYQIFTSSNAAG